MVTERVHQVEEFVWKKKKGYLWFLRSDKNSARACSSGQEPDEKMFKKSEIERSEPF